MYATEVQQVLAEQKKNTDSMKLVAVKLATVNAIVSGQGAKVTFYGEGTSSSKVYPYIDGYLPTVGDTVAMLPQADTYIILGKITKAFPTAKWASVSHNHDGVYIPVADAAKLVSGSRVVQLFVPSVGNPRLDPDTNGTIDIGASNYQFNNIYGKKLYLDGTEIPKEVLYRLKTTGSSYAEIDLIYGASNNSRLTPSVNGAISLGELNYRFKNVYANVLMGDWQATTQYTSGYYHALEWASGVQISPDMNAAVSIGTSQKQLKNLYAQNVYNNGTAVTSDKRKKKSIKSLAKKYIDMFWKLRPVSFKYKDGESGRLHTGYIAQEVEQAAADAGLTDKELAAVVIDEEGNYSLRYNELVAIQHGAILELKNEIEALKKEIAILKEGVHD